MTTGVDISDVCFEEYVPSIPRGLFGNHLQQYWGKQYVWNGERAAWDYAWGEGEKEHAITTLPLALGLVLRHENRTMQPTYVTSSVELRGFAQRDSHQVKAGEPVVVTIHPTGTNLFRGERIRRRLEERAKEGLYGVDPQVLNQVLRGKDLRGKQLLLFSYDEYVVETSLVRGHELQAKPHAVIRPLALAQETRAWEQPLNRLRQDSTLSAWFSPKGAQELLTYASRKFYRAKYALAVAYKEPTPGVVQYRQLRLGNLREGILCGEDGLTLDNSAFLAFPPETHTHLSRAN